MLSLTSPLNTLDQHVNDFRIHLHTWICCEHDFAIVEVPDEDLKKIEADIALAVKGMREEGTPTARNFEGCILGSAISSSTLYS